MKFLKILLLVMIVVLISSPSFAEEEVIRVGVLRFESKADGISQSNAESITDELTRMLTSSYSIAIIDRENIEAIAREHRMNLAGLIDPRTAAQLGRAANIQYLITGAITGFEITEGTDVKDTTGLLGLFIDKDTARNLGPQAVEKTENAELTLDVRVIDVNTHETVLAMAETGKATRRSTATRDIITGSSASINHISLRDSAVSDAVAKIGARIKEAVSGEYPEVLRVSGENIYVGLGATSGVKVGNLYKISLEGEEITDRRGKVLGRETTLVAIVRIEDVKNDYSVARVIKRGGKSSNVRRGDRVEKTSGDEAETLIRRKAISDRRPRKEVSDSDFEDKELDNKEPSISPASRSLENSSTDPARVIPTYGLPVGEAKAREELHRKLQRAEKNQNAYNHYVEMTKTYAGDYLAMYQAGLIAQSMGRKNDAVQWFDKALSVNPQYEPAIHAKENVNKPAPSSKSSGKRRRK